MTLFGIQQVLGKSFSAWAKNLVPFTVLAVLVYAPLILYTAWMVGELDSANYREQTNTWAFTVMLSGFVLDIVASAVVIDGVMHHFRGDRLNILDCLVAGLKRLTPVLGAGLVASSLTPLGALVFIFVHPFIGTAILILGVFVYLTFIVAVPAVVIDNAGVIESLQRSKALTEGHRLSIFGLFFLLGIIKRLVAGLIHAIVVGESAQVAEMKIYLFADLGVTIILGALGAVVVAVLFRDLRVMKRP